jgi:hypothetical protein
MGLMFDPVTGRRRVVWALIFTGVEQNVGVRGADSGS